MRSSALLEGLFRTLPEVTAHHSPDSALHQLLKAAARTEIEAIFSGTEPEPIDFQPFGRLVFPFHSMGAVDSLNLFDLDELILFTFYWVNRPRYRQVLDIGANLGLHSILLSHCGFVVRSFEPDPDHFRALQRNLNLNGCAMVQARNAAVSAKPGTMEFVRVLGNTTSSHLVGSKSEPYGELERFPVQVDGIDSLMEWADLVKLDAEGHEKEILLATERRHWSGTDAMIEVGDGNAPAVYEHLTCLELPLYSQKVNWDLVRCIEDVPTSYREGSLFVSGTERPPWPES